MPSTWRAGHTSLPGSRGDRGSWEEIRAERSQVAGQRDKERSLGFQSKESLAGKSSGDPTVGAAVGASGEEAAGYSQGAFVPRQPWPPLSSNKVSKLAWE